MTGTIRASGRPARYLRVTVLAVFVVYLIALYRGTPWLADPTTVGSDASNYFAAGQRLDDGHELYRLGPGDLPVPVLPPYYTGPLVSPPPVAVAWRPLALLPREVAIVGWWLVAITVLVATTVWFTGLGSILVIMGVLALTTELAITALSANLNALLIGALALAWLAVRASRPALAGLLVAVCVATKILPVLLVLWLLATGRRAAVVWCLGALGAIGVVSLLGAGLAAHLAWLDVARATSAEGAAPASLPGIARALGVPDMLARMVIPAVLVGGVAAVVLLRSRPGPAFAAAIVTLVAANPAVHDGSLALLLPALLPLARPMAAGKPSRPRIAPAAGAGQSETDSA